MTRVSHTVGINRGGGFVLVNRKRKMVNFNPGDVMKNCGFFFRCLELGSKIRNGKTNKKVFLQNMVVYITNNIPVR